jgi:hypothetical protein
MTPLSGSEAPRTDARPSKASGSIVVTTTAQLLAALEPHPGELTVFVQRGTYQINHAIEVPDNTALIGEGLMEFDPSGLPAGFVPDSRTVIVATTGVVGDFVSLGNGVSLRGLVIQDVIRPTATGGAVVAIRSREPRGRPGAD